MTTKKGSVDTNTNLKPTSLIVKFVNKLNGNTGFKTFLKKDDKIFPNISPDNSKISDYYRKNANVIKEWITYYYKNNPNDTINNKIINDFVK